MHRLAELSSIDRREQSLGATARLAPISSPAEALEHDQTWGKISIPFAFANGDFAPWDMRQGSDQLYVFGCEYAHGQTSVGADVCHYVMEFLLLIRKWTGAWLYNSFRRGGVFRQQLRVGFSRPQLVEELLETILLLYVLQRIAALTAADRIDRPIAHKLARFVYLPISPPQVMT